MANKSDSGKTESDVEQVEDVSPVKAAGGVAEASHPDQGSTTGTTPNGSFVGLVAGQDVGYSEETGAERRAQVAQEAARRGDEQAAAEAKTTRRP